MGHFLHAELAQILVVQAPADIVVAAQVVEEGIVAGQFIDRIQLMAQEPHVLGGHGVPDGCHGGHVVDHVAFGLVQGAEVGNDLLGLHDDLAQKHGAGAYDLGAHAHQADQGMDLGKVAAVGAQFLPDIGSGVQTDDVNAVVAEVEHVGRHVVEDYGVCIVQIPLIGIELGHDHLARFLAPGKVAGCRGGEYLGNGLFELVGDGPVVIEEISVLIFLFAGPGPLCPGVVLAGMVHDKVKADAHAAAVALGAQLRQILHGAQLGLDLAEVGYGVAAVAPVLGALQKGHQMQVVDAAFLDIVQMADDALQVSRKAVGVHQHAQDLAALDPVGIGHSGPVPLLEEGRPGGIVLVEHLQQVVEGLLVVVVDLSVEPFHLVVVFFQTLDEFRLPALIHFHTNRFLLFYAKGTLAWTSKQQLSGHDSFTICNRFHYKIPGSFLQF